MVPYILTNTIDYPVAGEDWTQKFKEFYQGRIIEGFLDSTAFLRKLQDTFNLNEIALGELPEDACSYLFGCRKIEEHVTGKGLDPENYEDRAWFVKEDDRSEVFYRYQRQRNIIQISQSPYQYLPQKEMQVYIVRTKDQTGFDSNNQLMSLFLIWYRGMTEKTAFHPFYRDIYLSSIHYMIGNLKWVFGEKKYVKLLKKAQNNRKYLNSHEQSEQIAENP